MFSTSIIKRWSIVFLVIYACPSLYQYGHAETSLMDPDDNGSVEVYLPVISVVNDGTPAPDPTPYPTQEPGPTPIPPPPSGTPKVYYMSPSGSDYNSGTSEALPWATFNHAWHYLYPGDTLVLLDGVYYQRLNPSVRNGQPGYPITIQAKNDGKAIIDGENHRIPIKLGDTWSGESGENPVGNYFVIEGVVAKNSSDYPIEINASHHNILRRVSAYNADTDGNSVAIGIIWSSAHDNLVEDCIASGSGRKMIMIYEGHNNTIRRCLIEWKEWEGKDFCGVTWPFGDGIQVYSGDYNTVENNLVIGMIPDWSVSIQANDPSLDAIGNKILGTVATSAGIKPDGTVMTWGTVRPQPNDCPDMITDFNWPGMRSGFMLYGQGELSENTFQDIFAWGNAGLGLSTIPGTDFHPNNHDNIVDHATLFNNGLDNPDGPWPGQFGGTFTDALADELSEFTSVTNSKIDKIFVSWPNYPSGVRNLDSMNGEGARLSYRYVDGVLTSQPLWPWPMESRIQAELGFSITDYMTNLIFGTTNLGEIYP